MKRTPVAVMGATGLVGLEFLRRLEDHPLFRVVALTASPRSIGKTLSEILPREGRAIPFSEERVLPTDPDLLASRGVRAVFSALPTVQAGEVESRLRERGVGVFTNASCHRTDPDVPILMADINPDHLLLAKRQSEAFNGGFIVAGPNCSTAGVVSALRPLERWRIRGVVASTYQSLSGAGRKGVGALQILDNLIPFIPGEEEKMERESRKILGPLVSTGVLSAPWSLFARCCRAAVTHGHLISLVVETEEEADDENVAEALSSYRSAPQRLGLPSAPPHPLVVCPEEDRPQPRLDREAGGEGLARGMAVTVGRIRCREGRISLFLLVNNLVRGAAGTCLLNAELAAAEGLLV